MVRVGNGSQGRNDDAGGGQRIPAPSPVDKRASRGDGNERPHGELCDVSTPRRSFVSARKRIMKAQQSVVKHKR